MNDQDFSDGDLPYQKFGLQSVLADEGKEKNRHIAG
jgi:hypothetical protein